jgi:hypothetical protein
VIPSSSVPCLTLNCANLGGDDDDDDQQHLRCWCVSLLPILSDALPLDSTRRRKQRVQTVSSHLSVSFPKCKVAVPPELHARNVENDAEREVLLRIGFLPDQEQLTARKGYNSRLAWRLFLLGRRTQAANR